MWDGSLLLSKKLASFDIINLLYVDDMLIVVLDMQEINKLKKKLSRGLESKDLRVAK